MNSYIALLRGINVGGHKKILMADLKLLFEKLKFKNVQTYIQSGNVIFHSTESNSGKLEKMIKNQILVDYGFEVPILVKTPSEIKSILNECPFKEEKKENSYFTLLHPSPEDELIELTNKISYPNEEFLVTKSCVYFYSSTGYGNVKCNNNFFEKKLGVSSSSRNFRTLSKLIELSS